jgi:hypothetical protein
MNRCVRHLLLAGVTAALLLAQPLKAQSQSQAQPAAPAAPAGDRQQEQCQKLGAKVTRLKTSRNKNRDGFTAANNAYAAGIAKLSKRYGYDPCPGLKAPNV